MEILGGMKRKECIFQDSFLSGSFMAGDVIGSITIGMLTSCDQFVLQLFDDGRTRLKADHCDTPIDGSPLNLYVTNFIP